MQRMRSAMKMSQLAHPRQLPSRRGARLTTAAFAGQLILYLHIYYIPMVLVGLKLGRVKGCVWGLGSLAGGFCRPQSRFQHQSSPRFTADGPLWRACSSMRTQQFKESCHDLWRCSLWWSSSRCHAVLEAVAGLMQTTTSPLQGPESLAHPMSSLSQPSPQPGWPPGSLSTTCSAHRSSCPGHLPHPHFIQRCAERQAETWEQHRAGLDT